MKNLIALLIVALITLGCAALNPPRNSEDSVAYSYAVLTAIENATADSVAANQVSLETAQKIQNSAAEIRKLLAAGRLAIEAKDRAASVTLSAQAAQALSALQRYLTNQRRKKPMNVPSALNTVDVLLWIRQFKARGRCLTFGGN